MDDKKKLSVSELGAEDLLQLAAENMGVEGNTLSSIEVGLDQMAQSMSRLELSRRLNESETREPKKMSTVWPALWDPRQSADDSDSQR